MGKKRGISILIVIVGLIGLNLYFFTKQKSKTFLQFSLSGNAIADLNPLATLRELLPQEMGLSMIIFICQWVLIVVIAFIAYLRYLRKKRREAQIAKIPLEPSKKTSETDFDTLYQYLTKKEKLSTKTISKLFKIPKEKALEWAKILEENELVTIDYPAFSDPEVIIKQEKNEEGKQKEEMPFKEINKEVTKKITPQTEKSNTEIKTTKKQSYKKRKLKEKNIHKGLTNEKT